MKSSCEICNTVVVIAVSAAVLLAWSVYRRKKSSPHRPLVTCVLDSFCDLPFRLRLGPWSKPNDIFTAIEDAKHELKISDLGGSDQNTFIQRYDTARKVGQSQSRAEFSPLGYFMVYSSMKRRMSTRIQFFDYLRRHPDIEKTQNRDPIFVIGFPRTGTTFLHELLGLHPSVRMHYTWEQMDPIPRTHDESLSAQSADRKMRYETNKPIFDTMMYLGGDSIQSVHRVGYDEPEECTTPCSMELPWNLTELPFQIFAINEIVALKGAGDTFEYYKRFLQLLTWQASDRRDQDFTWMLKCPFHLPYLTELNAAFPNSTVVWTHRNPVECIASACSLYETLMHMAMEESSIDRIALGKAVMEYTRVSLKMANDTIEALKDKFKIVHVRYVDNVKNSKNVCHEIVDKAGLAFDGEYERRIDEYLAKNAAQRQKLKEKKSSATLHEYHLEDYGLSKDIVSDAFREYINKYNL